jgi:hypothetical protein
VHACYSRHRLSVQTYPEQGGDGAQDGPNVAPPVLSPAGPYYTFFSYMWSHINKKKIYELKKETSYCIL